jgi:hypothetical protein
MLFREAPEHPDFPDYRIRNRGAVFQFVPQRANMPFAHGPQVPCPAPLPQPIEMAVVNLLGRRP